MNTSTTPISCTQNLLLTLATGTLTHFTTLLQSGIFLEARQGISLGSLLDSQPGFDHNYITERVQTIFIDGLPADDLAQPLTGTKTVVAVSAAMPGLAGAIFRKNGVHASLRTTPSSEVEKSSYGNISLTIQLKLFNMIAEERGAEILQNGCTVDAPSLGKFFSYRRPLLQHVQKFSLNEKTTDIEVLQPLLQTAEKIHLHLQEQP